MEKKDRKQLLEQYKQIKTYMGVIQITNTSNGKIYISSYPNLKNKWIVLQSYLNSGKHINPGLQEDWKKIGAENFIYQVLEEKTTDDVKDVRWELKQMENRWLENLQPYGDRGYNKPPK